MINKRGFTMLEMLAVLAILSIVFSFAYVYMQSSLESTQKSACQNKLELVASAEKRFFATQNRHSIEFENLGVINGQAELVDKFYLDWNQSDNFSINVEIETETPLVYRLSCSEYEDIYLLQEESEYRRDYFLTYPDVTDEGDVDDIDLDSDYEEDLSDIAIVWDTFDYPVAIGFNEGYEYEEGTILFYDQPLTYNGEYLETSILEALEDTSLEPNDGSENASENNLGTTWEVIHDDALEDTKAKDILYYIIEEGEDSIIVPEGNSFLIGHDNGIYINALTDSNSENNNNFISGGYGDDILIGGPRSDNLLGQEGNDFIDGGDNAGNRIDTAIFVYPINEYTLEIVSPSVIDPTYTSSDDYIEVDFKGDLLDLYIGDDTLYLITHPVEGQDYFIRIDQLYFQGGTVSIDSAYDDIGQ